MNKNGLTSAQVADMIKQGNVNAVKKKSGQSYFSIFVKNIFTYFNAIFLIIALLLVSVKSYRNLTFLPVIIANVVIGIFQQIRSKRVLDRLSLLDKSVYTVIRDGAEIKLPSDKLVQGDLIVLKGGQQIPADAVVEEGFLSVNESLLTGESDEIEKTENSELLSGSFVVSGQAYVTLVRVGKKSYSAELMAKAKEIKDKKSEMIKDIERIILFAGIIIIPIGIALFCQAYVTNKLPLAKSIESMVAAIIGMIPEGMYLLTTVALALSAIRLAQNHVLLHDMRSIETLARVDVLCVDKTGTITENDMTVTGTYSPENYSDDDLANELRRYLLTVTDENQTATAMKKYFLQNENGNTDGAPCAFSALKIQNFSSKTKYSAVFTQEFVYKLGAPEAILGANISADTAAAVKEEAEAGKRVLAFAKIKDEKILSFMLVFLNNEIRKNAPEIFGFFDKQGVEIKVISGDNPLTVSRVAKKAGIKNAEKFVDASTLSDEDIYQAVKQYTVFGRVKPEQKKLIILALKKLGLKVAMTGDGVNDILAMKEADCSISMGTGSDAAREASQVVLMDSDFMHMQKIVSEGRRDINNITRTATLFLYKNIFSVLMATFAIISFTTYPLQPSQVSLVSMFNIGVPAFLLTLEPNERKQRGKFINETLLRALPAALTSFLAIVALGFFAGLFDISQEEIGTASTYLLSVGGFIILWHIIKPVNKYSLVVYLLCIAGFTFCINVFYDWFEIESVSLRGWGLCVLFAIAEASVMRWIAIIVKYAKAWIEKRKNKACKL